MKGLLELFGAFFRIGLFTFGGGYAMMPLIQKEVVEKKGWSTEEEVLDYYAVAQCTPGVVAINTATFIGYKQKGIVGGIVATIGVITPSWIIISIIAGVLQRFAEIELVQHAFVGIRIAVIAVVIQTIVKMGKTALKDGLGVVMMLAAFVLVAFVKVSSVWLVIAAIAVGILANTFKEKRNIQGGAS